MTKAELTKKLKQREDRIICLAYELWQVHKEIVKKCDVVARYHKAGHRTRGRDTAVIALFKLGEKSLVELTKHD